jgi:hypothetical protein
MSTSMRRPGSTQALSQKVEGIEPRNTRTRKDDAVKPAEVNISTTEKARRYWHSSGSDTMASPSKCRRWNRLDRSTPTYKLDLLNSLECHR